MSRDEAGVVEGSLGLCVSHDVANEWAQSAMSWARSTPF